MKTAFARVTCMAVLGASVFAASVEDHARLWPAERQQQPVYRSRVDAVVVDVLVTDQGRPVRGLSADDFDVRDNGVRQNVDLSARAGRVHLVLALDTSGSVAGEKLQHLREAAQAAALRLEPADSVSLTTFSHRLFLHAAARQEIGQALDEQPASGRTALHDAVYAALSLTQADVGRSLLLVCSDGLDNASWLSEDDVVDAVDRADVVVYAIAAGPGSGFLHRIADRSGGEFLEAKADRRLASVFARVLEEFRARYLLSFTPTGVEQGDGWHRLTVSLKGRSGRVRARPGYVSRRQP